MFPRPRTEVAPGAVHLPGWLSPEQQRQLVAECRAWARGPVPMRHITLPGGARMSVRTVCVGWDWQPYRYRRTSVDGTAVAPFPEWLADLGRAAVAEAYGGSWTGAGGWPGADGTRSHRDYAPDTALINYYDAAARMGLHQDKDEKSDAPVVSLSVGDSCVFRFGNTTGRTRPWTDLVLESGDAFVFGGPSRYAYHGVPKILPGTGPGDIGMVAAGVDGAGLAAGRLNVTLRETGLAR